MREDGRTGRDRRRSFWLVAAGMLASALPVWAVWGFTVDDALIPARVAMHLATGVGYRFNLHGPIVDASTPIGWPYLLMPFAAQGVEAAHRAAKIIGAAAWVAAAGGLGAMIDHAAQRRLRFGVLAVLAVCLPLGAWAASGMETGIVMALCTAALISHPLGALCAGLAAAWRPELIAWAVVLSSALALTDPSRGAAHPSSDPLARSAPPWGALFRALAFAALPSVAVAGVRSYVFGRAAPLAVFAKPSDASHGIYYAAAGLIWLGIPITVLAPFAIRKLAGRHWAVLLATGAHTLSLIAAGGDWMPYFRLWTPVAPGLLLVGAAVIDASPLWASATRIAFAFIVCVALDVRHLAPARAIEAQRATLVEQGRRLLAGVRFPASVDVGWVGAIADNDVRDLAGVTDLEVALLPGGHTSKEIPGDWLERRQVDCLVLLLASGENASSDYDRARFARTVEGRIAGFARPLAFEPIGSLPLIGTEQRYLVLRRSAPP